VYAWWGFEAETLGRGAKGVERGVDRRQGSGERATTVAEGDRSLPRTSRLGVVVGAATELWGQEVRKLGSRQGEAGHARRHSRGLARKLRRRLTSEAARSGGSFAH